MTMLLTGAGLAVPGGAPAATLLLDETGLGTATAGWSYAFKLRAAHTGNVMTIRRLSDDAELAIGFDDVETDRAAMEAFCAGTDGFVVTCNDQTANGYDITMATTTAQPKIVSSGAVLTGANGKPRADFSASTSIRIQNVSGINLTQPVTHFSVLRQNAWTGNRRLWSGNNSVEEGRQFLYQSSVTPDLRLGSAGTGGIINNGLATSTWGIIRSLLNGASSELQVNAGTATSGNAGSIKLRGFTMGSSQAGGDGANCDFQEHVIWPEALSSDEITAARNNINARYAIF